MRVLVVPLLTIAVMPSTSVRAQQWTGIRSAPDGPTARGGVGRELGKIDRDIDAGKRSGQLSRRETKALRRANGAIDTLQSRFASDGISPGEQWELDGRARALSDQVSNARITGK